MRLILKYSQNGNCLCLMLTKEAVRALGAAKGATVYMTPGPDGQAVLSPYDPEFDAQLKIAERGMAEYRDALRALAKR